MRARAAGLAVALAAVAAACGVPVEEQPRAVNPRDVPPVLAETTAPTTTAGTTTSAGPVEPTATSAPPSTVPQELVTLYFVQGTRLVPVARSLSSPVSPGETLAELAAGPLPSDPRGLREVLPPDAVLGVDVRRGRATVDLREGVLQRVLPGDAVYLWGQIVLTLTGRPGIGQVAVTVDGEPTTIQRGDGSVAEVVFAEDYDALLEGRPPPTTTTTTTAAPAPPTTVP